MLMKKKFILKEIKLLRMQYIHLESYISQQYFFGENSQSLITHSVWSVVWQLKATLCSGWTVQQVHKLLYNTVHHDTWLFLNAMNFSLI